MPPAAAPPRPDEAEPRQATISVEAELRAPGCEAQIVRFDIPSPTETVLRRTGSYQIDMCLTPRPDNARGCYPEHWGRHRFERLGDVFLIPPDEDLLVRGTAGRQASLLCTLDTALITDIVGQDLAWSDPQLAATLDLPSARIRALLMRLTEEVRIPGLACDRMLGFISGELAVELARFCLEAAERPGTGGLSGWRLRLIEERLADNPAAPALAELASLCGLSVRQLTRGFRVSRGCSIGDYVEQRRMENAKRLLVAGESVKAVAFALGFASPSSFTYAFRRAVGASPRVFRQRQARVLAEA